MSESRSHSRRSAIVIGGLSAAMIVSVAATGASAAPTPAPSAAKVLNNAACPSTPGVTPTTVNYGYISSRTGPAANTFSGAEEAARLRIAQENAKGGVYGRKIIMKGYDDQTNPSTQVSVVQQAIGDNSFGVSTATSTVSGYPTLTSQGIPITGFNAQAFGQDRNAFGVTGPTLPPGIASIGLIQKLQKLGVTRIANINHVSAGATASGNNTSAAIKLVPGVTESLRIADSPQSTHDATSEALRIKNSNSDGLIYVGFVEGGVSIAQAMAQQGVKLKGMSITGLSDPAQLKTTGNSLDGAIGTGAGTVPVGVNNAAVRTYANGMKAAGLNPYSTYAPIGYLGADLFIRGLKEAGPCPTRQKFIDTLRKVTGYNGNGLLPDKISFTPGLTPNGDPISCGWYLTAQGNQLIPDKAATCGATYIDTATGKVVFQGHN